MKAGAGHAKGAAFERELARSLSNWLTGGRDDRALWRSVGSGAHAQRWHGRQSGDLAAVQTDWPLVQRFAAEVLVEAKAYRSLSWSAFHGEHAGELWRFWVKASAEARAQKRTPWLVVKINYTPTVVILPSLPDNRSGVEVHRYAEWITSAPTQILDYSYARHLV